VEHKFKVASTTSPGQSNPDLRRAVAWRFLSIARINI
jgi:hypothetical protein